MNPLVLAGAVLAALNPPARAVRFRHLDDRRAVLAALAVLAVVLGLAAVAEPLFDAADVSAPNARVAAGLVVTVTGLVDLVRRPAPAADLPPGDRSALVPVAFPGLLEPQVGVLALAAGADEGLLLPTALAAVVLVLWVLADRVRTPFLPPLGRLVGALGVLAGTALTVDGVLSV